MAMAFSRGSAPGGMSQEDIMRMLALRAGALPPRGQDNAPPADILPNGAALMRSGDVFGGNGLSQSAASAKQILDNQMLGSPGDQPPPPMPMLAPASTPSAIRPGMAFRGLGARGGTPAPQTYVAPDQPVPTGLAGLDSVQPLNLTPPTRIDDPTSGGVNDKIHPGFLEYGGLGRKIAGVLGDGLLDLAAANGDPMATMNLRQRAAQQDAQRQLAVWQQQEATRRQQDLEDRNYEDNQKPRYFQSAPGTDYNKFDPASGQVTSIYQSPTAAQDYASNFGNPGSEGYARAMQDFVLKSWSPTAIQGRQTLDDYRTRNRIEVKGAPSFANLHPKPAAPRAPHAPTTSNVVATILSKGASGQQLNSQEQQIFNSYVNGRYRGRSGSSGIPLAGSAGGGSAPIRVNTPDEARKLPPGTVFMTPDGRTKVR